VLRTASNRNAGCVRSLAARSLPASLPRLASFVICLRARARNVKGTNLLLSRASALQRRRRSSSAAAAGTQSWHARAQRSRTRSAARRDEVRCARAASSACRRCRSWIQNCLLAEQPLRRRRRARLSAPRRCPRVHAAAGKEFIKVIEQTQPEFRDKVSVKTWRWNVCRRRGRTPGMPRARGGGARWRHVWPAPGATQQALAAGRPAAARVCSLRHKAHLTPARRRAPGRDSSCATSS
jgi:hypothetical protein